MVRSTMPEWTVLRPSWFMQNFTGDHLVAQGVRDGEIVTATGDGRVAFVDAADIAAVAGRALIDDEPHNAEYILTGPDALSYEDAAGSSRRGSDALSDTARSRLRNMLKALRRRAYRRTSPQSWPPSMSVSAQVAKTGSPTRCNALPDVLPAASDLRC